MQAFIVFPCIRSSAGNMNCSRSESWQFIDSLAITESTEKDPLIKLHQVCVNRLKK